jgi:hypothetical protein
VGDTRGNCRSADRKQHQWDMSYLLRCVRQNSSSIHALNELNEGRLLSPILRATNDRNLVGNRHDRSGASEIVLDILYHLCSFTLAVMTSPNQVIKDEQNQQKPNFVTKVSKVRVLKRGPHLWRRQAEPHARKLVALCRKPTRPFLQICPFATSWPNTALTRVCQPGPLPRRCSTVLASRRIFTST